MEINHWTSTEFTKGEWDADEKCWVATLKMEDGSARVMRPRHIVFANGVSSFPLKPEIPGLDTFKGDVIYSGRLRQRCAVCRKESDRYWDRIECQRYCARSSQFWMRHDPSATRLEYGCPIEPSAKLNYALYDEGRLSKIAIFWPRRSRRPC